MEAQKDTQTAYSKRCQAGRENLLVERAHAKIGLRALNNAFSIEQVATPSGYPYTLVNMPYYHAEYWKKYVEFALN